MDNNIKFKPKIRRTKLSYLQIKVVDVVILVKYTKRLKITQFKHFDNIQGVGEEGTGLLNGDIKHADSGEGEETFEDARSLDSCQLQVIQKILQWLIPRI